MWWILAPLAGLAGLVALLALVGLAIPRGHVAARRARYARPVDDVWRAITDLDAQPGWRRGLRAIERVSATEFRELSGHGAIRYAIVADEPPRVRVHEIADPKLPFGGRWIFELTGDGDGDGATLAITEDGFIKNPVFRTLSRTVFSTSANLERYLADLGAHLGAPATVEPAPPSSRAAR